MRKLDLPIHNYEKTLRPNGQEWKQQLVVTPWGRVVIWGNTEVLKLRSSKRNWKLWFYRFVLSRPIHTLNDETRKTVVEFKTEI